MEFSDNNETWIIETGDAVLQKKADSGRESLSPWERLVYCLWVADYGMRNAGDLETAADVYPEFQSEARLISKALSLRLTHNTFSLPASKLQKEYLVRFESMCEEIRRAEPKSPSNGEQTGN